MNSYYKIVGLTIASFVIGFFLWPDFFELSRNEIKSSQMIISRGSFSWGNGQILFASSISLIPLLYMGVIKLAKIKSTQQKVTSIAILLACGFLIWQGRLLTVILENRQTNSMLISTDIHFEYPISELQPQLFLAIGLITGTIVSIIIFKAVNRRTKE